MVARDVTIFSGAVGGLEDLELLTQALLDLIVCRAHHAERVRVTVEADDKSELTESHLTQLCSSGWTGAHAGHLTADEAVRPGDRHDAWDAEIAVRPLWVENPVMLSFDHSLHFVTTPSFRASSASRKFLLMYSSLPVLGSSTST